MSVKTLRPFIIILLILLVFAGWRYQSGRQRPSIITQTGLEALVTRDLSADAVKKVVLYAAAKPEETVEIVREGDGWQLATLHNAPADAKKVGDFLDKVLRLKGEPRAVAKNDGELAPYGLKDGEGFRVRAYTDPAGAPKVDLIVGKSPDFRTVFMRQAGAMQVYVEAANLRREAGVFSDDAESAPGSGHWLDKTVLALERDQVKRLAFTYPDKAFTVAQVTIEEPAPDAPEVAGDDEEATPPPPPVTRTEWQVVEGGAGLSFKEAGVTSLLTKLSTFTCTSVVDPDKKPDYGLDAPGFRLAIGLEDGTERVVIAARPEPTGNAYAVIEGAGKDIVYEIDGFTFEQLFPKGQTLFDLPALSIARDDIGRVTIEQPEGRVVVVKEDGDWKVVEPAINLDTQTTLVSTLVSTLGNWRPADFAAPEADLGEATRSITVVAGEETYVLRGLGDVPGQDAIYVRREGLETPLVMARTDINRLFLKPRDVFQLTLLRVDEEEVRNVLVKTDEANFALERGAEGWIVREGGVERAADAEAARQLVTNLATLQADDIRSDRANIGGDPLLNLGIRTSESLPRYLAIGPEEDGKHLLSLSGLNATFEIDAEAVRALSSLIADLKPKADTSAEEAIVDEAPVEEAPASEPPAPAAPEAGDAAAADGADTTGEVAAEAAPADESVASEADQADDSTMPAPAGDPAPADGEAAPVAPES